MTIRGPLLLIEDDPILGPAIVQRLRLEGFDITLCDTGRGAIETVKVRRPVMIISDIRLPDMDGEVVFNEVVRTIGLIPYFFITAFGDISQAVRLVKAGALDYLVKPLDMNAVVPMISASMMSDLPATGAGPSPALGVSDAMAAVEVLCRKAARTTLPILLTGETGTGKEVVARFLHGLSGADRPFVPINCAAIPRDLAESILFGHERGAFTGAIARKAGLVEAASGGTLFLDEIGELAPDLQAKLLRLVQENTYRPVAALSEKCFDGRLICATHADLQARVADGHFREDLYYRINVMTIHVPALRERRADISWLAARFLAAAKDGSTRRLDPGAVAALEAYAWPGNVRELRNRVERAAALSEGPVITAAELFPEAAHAPLAPLTQATGLRETVDIAMRARILDALQACGGKRSKAARMLGISRTSLWKKMRDLGIDTDGE